MTNIAGNKLLGCDWSYNTRRSASAAFLVLTMALTAMILANDQAKAQTFTSLHIFEGSPDGRFPWARLVRDSAGNLYGTTEVGGAFDLGTVFKLNTTGKYKVLYSFTGGTDGAQPKAALVRDAAGNLYGTAQSGGNLSCGDPYGIGCGTVFKLDQTGGYAVLYTFNGGADGAAPVAGLVRDGAGNLYGATVSGGDLTCVDPYGYGGCGTVFKLDTNGKHTVLHKFAAIRGDGNSPSGRLIRDASGNLYGATPYGGSGSGTLFQLNTAGKETVLYRFNGGTDGASPSGGLIRDNAGNLYGTTGGGGDVRFPCRGGCGTVFKLDTTGKHTVLYTFIAGGPDGAGPTGDLVRDAAGNLYGTTASGGDFSCSDQSQGCGTIFKLDTSGNYTVLYTFIGSSDGSLPFAGLIRDASGNLYGTTYQAGDTSCFFPIGCGTVFKFAP